MVLELDLATRSCVYREYSRGLRTQPWGDPVLSVRGLEFAHPDALEPGVEGVHDPGTQGGFQTQLNQLASQSAGKYGVESRTKGNKQHSPFQLSR